CAFVVSGFIMFFAIVRYRIADVVPIARDFVLENINEALFVIGTDNKLLDVNRAGQEFIDLNPDAGIGGDARAAFARVPALAGLLSSTPGATVRFDTSFGSETRTHDARIDTLVRGAGIRVGRVMTCRDVTREVAAARELREREDRYRVLFEESPIALWLEDFSGVHAYFDDARKAGVTDWAAYFDRNPRAVRECAARVKILRCNAQAIAQHAAGNKANLLANLPAIFTEQSFEVFRDELVALASGQTSFHGEAEHRTLAGSVFWVSVNLRIVPGFETQFERVLVSNIDISERKRADERRLHLERQIQQTQKLESLGVLAGGIAHDFNNILVAILGNASLMMDDVSPTSPVYPSVRAIEGAAHRAADLCRQMLAYAGKGQFAVKPTDLRTVVRDMMPLLQHSVSKKAALTLNDDTRIPAIEGDATQIEQVVLNLVINASEALGEHVGAITISIGTESCSRERLAPLPYSESLPEGEYVYIEVSDTGSGMDESTKERLFEPFFSTKFTGRG
ncbi:MAG: hypothetical protein FJY92_12710, partial [Candidatus Hydrogenedentes bacterium]|nr:hypothetical protein [Candidatus Hydrogenedentota bacterium]